MKKKLKVLGIIALIIASVCIFGAKSEASSATKDIYITADVDLKRIFSDYVDESDIIYDYWSDPQVAYDRDFNESIEVKNVAMGDKDFIYTENDSSSTVELPLSPDLNITISVSEDTDKVYVRVPEMMITANLLDPIRVKPLIGEEQDVDLYGEQWHTLSVQENEPKKDGTKSILVTMDPVGDTELRPETMRLTANGMTFEGSTHIRGKESFYDYTATYFVFTDVPADMVIDWETASLEILSLMHVEDTYVMEYDFSGEPK